MIAASPDEIEREAERELAELGLTGRLSKAYSANNVPTPDLKKLRELLRCSQSEFAERFGLNLRTVQQWEQGRSEPDQPARILLTAIEIDPDAVARAASIAIRRARNVGASSSVEHVSFSALVLPASTEPHEMSFQLLKGTALHSKVRLDPNRDKKFAA
jgi:putative transcriptional regulator